MSTAATFGDRKPDVGQTVSQPVRTAAADQREMLLVAVLIFGSELVRSTTRLLSGGEDGDTSSVAQAVFGSIYVFAAIRLFQMRKQLRGFLPSLRPLMVFVGITTLSTVWSVDPITTFKDAVELIGTTVIAIYFATRFTLAQFLNMLVYTYTAISGFSAFLVVVSPSRGRTEWGAGPWCGLFVEKNGLGVAMALGAVTLVPLLLQSRGWKRIGIVGLLMLSLVLLVGANSMTSLLICMLVALICSIAFAVRSKKYGLLIAAVVAAAIGFVLVFGVFGVEQSELFGLIGRSSTLTGRTEMWPSLFTAIFDRPILGFGYNTFFQPNGPYFGYLADFLAEFFWTPPHAHNSFIQIALDTGAVGVVSFLVVLIVGIVRAVRYFMTKRTFISIWPLAIILFLLLGSYDEVYFEEPNTLQWLFFVGALLFPYKDMLDRKADRARPPSGVASSADAFSRS